MSSRKTLNIAASFPPKFAPFLTENARYKVVHGGRGGGKSVSIAKALLLRGQEKPLRILCCREIQQSIRESVHHTLADEIGNLGLSEFYTIEKSVIRGKPVRVVENGVEQVKQTEFFFSGLKSNIQQIKSYHAIDICWIEESESLSYYSWRILDPTIRQPNSEIWISFNPESEYSCVHQRFLVAKPTNAIVIEMNYWDNPWFADPLVTAMEQMKAENYEEYLHVWCGHTSTFRAGAVYLNEMRWLDDNERIKPLQHDTRYPVEVFMDLGFHDATALWCAQKIGPDVMVLDYHENRQKSLDYYANYLETLPWKINKIWLPRDARQRAIGTGLSSEDILRAKGYRVGIVPSLSIAEGINAVRSLHQSLYFDRDRCADGLQSLRQYRYELEADAKGGFKSIPVHDRWSHGCLTGDSMVDTEHGPKRIDQIIAGDRVWTPAGYADVTWSGPVKLTSDLVKLETSDGRTLCCTPEHKIATNSGFLQADAIRYTDSLLTGSEYSCVLIGLLSRATNIGFRATITGEMSGGAAAPATYIARFGKTRMAQSLKTIMSTTLTAIRSTTTCLTSDWLGVPSICGNTLSNFERLAFSMTPLSDAANVLPNGITRTRAAHGIPNTQSEVQQPVSGMSAFVRNAVSRLCRLALSMPSTVTSTVKCSPYDAAGGRQWVYDLTVANHACYRANGVLVSNSDAARYMALSLRPPKVKPDASKYFDPYIRTRAGAGAWMSL